VQQDQWGTCGDPGQLDPVDRGADDVGECSHRLLGRDPLAGQVVGDRAQPGLPVCAVDRHRQRLLQRGPPLAELPRKQQHSYRVRRGGAVHVGQQLGEILAKVRVVNDGQNWPVPVGGHLDRRPAVAWPYPAHRPLSVSQPRCRRSMGVDNGGCWVRVEVRWGDHLLLMRTTGLPVLITM
jgi:hypothetical protein